MPSPLRHLPIHIPIHTLIFIFIFGIPVFAGSPVVLERGRALHPRVLAAHLHGRGEGGHHLAFDVE